MKTAFIVCNAAELLTAERVLILKKIMKFIKTSVHQRAQKKSKANKKRPALMLMDENEARNIDNENLENERRERAVIQ